MRRNLDHVVRDAQPAIVFVSCIVLGCTHSFEIAGGAFAGLQAAALATWAVNRLAMRSSRRMQRTA